MSTLTEANIYALKNQTDVAVEMMSEVDLLKKLSEELQICAGEYAAETEISAAPESAIVVDLLVKRCEKFSSEIVEAINLAQENTNVQTAKDKFSPKNWRAKKYEEVFARVESRESRLEKLYGEVLRAAHWEPELRNLLRMQYTMLRRWHSWTYVNKTSKPSNFIKRWDSRLPDSMTDEQVKSQIRDAMSRIAISPATIARAIWFAIEQPDDVDVGEIVVRPTAQS